MNKKNVNLLLASVFLTLFVSACNSSASSDAKKIEIKQVAATTQSTTPESNEEVVKTTEVKTDEVMRLDSSVLLKVSITLN